jgi:hypothetical protein
VLPIGYQQNESPREKEKAFGDAQEFQFGDEKKRVFAVTDENDEHHEEQ